MRVREMPRRGLAGNGEQIAGHLGRSLLRGIAGIGPQRSWMCIPAAGDPLLARKIETPRAPRQSPDCPCYVSDARVGAGPDAREETIQRALSRDGQERWLNYGPA